MKVHAELTLRRITSEPVREAPERIVAAAR
jgi:hypothetical protein